MRDLIVFFPLAILYLAVKSTLLPEIPFPDIMLLLVFYVAYTRTSLEGAFLGFILGYIEDVFTGGVIGSTSFGLVMAFLAVHLVSRRMHFTTPVVKAAGAASLSLFKGLLLFVVIDFASGGLRFAVDIFFQAVLTGIFAPAILAGLGRLTALVHPRTFEG